MTIVGTDHVNTHGELLIKENHGVNTTDAFLGLYVQFILVSSGTLSFKSRDIKLLGGGGRTPDLLLVAE